MSLFNRHRPQSLDAIIGNDVVIQTLKANLAKKDPPHAFLLTGERGTGKTTTARIIASMLGCKDMDFVELDSAQFRGIDGIREIRRQSQFRSMSADSKCRVWFMDEVHQQTPDAQEALLKALEDPPKHVFYILATTDPQKLKKTLIDRCSHYAMSLLSEHDMYKLLRIAVKKEGQELTKEIYDLIIRNADGHPRTALQILDQVLDVDPELRLEVAKKAQDVEAATIDLCRSLMKKEGWKKVSVILRGIRNENPEQIRRAVLGYFQSVVLNSGDRHAFEIMCWFETPTYDIGMPGITMACYAIVNGK